MASSENQYESTISKNKSSGSRTDFTLRPIRVSDADDITKWASDEKVTRFTRWETDFFTSRDAVLNFIKNEALPNPLFRAICVDDRVIGWCFATPNPPDSFDGCRAVMSMMLAFEFWGNGIGLKVLKMMTSMVFKELPHVVRLGGFVHPENKTMQRLLERAGYQREGLLRKFFTVKGKPQDWVVFSILSSDLINEETASPTTSRL